MKIVVPKQMRIVQKILNPIWAHRLFIVIVLLLGGLSAAVYQVSQILELPTDVSYRDTKTQATIGNKFKKSAKDTIAKIESLQKSSDKVGKSLALPAGRINPFAE
jgi:hypothetical protein